MNDILPHTTTFALGLLLFFAVLHELVMAFKRKKVLDSASKIETVRAWDKAHVGGDSSYSGVFRRNGDGSVEKIAELDGSPVKQKEVR